MCDELVKKREREKEREKHNDIHIPQFPYYSPVVLTMNSKS